MATVSEYTVCMDCIESWVKEGDGPHAGDTVNIVEGGPKCELGFCYSVNGPGSTFIVVQIDDGQVRAVVNNTVPVHVIDMDTEGAEFGRDYRPCRCSGFDPHYHHVYEPEQPAGEGA